MCRNGNSISSAGPRSCTIKHQTELVIGCGRNVYKPIIPTAAVLTGCSGLLSPFPSVSRVSQCAGIEQTLPCSPSSPSCLTDRRSHLPGALEMFFIPFLSWGYPRGWRGVWRLAQHCTGRVCAGGGCRESCWSPGDACALPGTGRVLCHPHLISE